MKTGVLNCSKIAPLNMSDRYWIHEADIDVISNVQSCHHICSGSHNYFYGTVAVVNPRKITTRLCSWPQLCSSLKGLSAHCFVFLAHSFDSHCCCFQPQQVAASIENSGENNCNVPTQPKNKLNLMPTFSS